VVDTLITFSANLETDEISIYISKEIQYTAFYVIYRGIFLLFLLQISVQVFSLLDYICIADGDLITKKWRIGIKLTSLIPEHVCAYPKPGPGFQSTYVIVCLYNLTMKKPAPKSEGETVKISLYK
jgi:hypothetical protein